LVGKYSHGSKGKEEREKEYLVQLEKLKTEKDVLQEGWLF